MQIGSFVTPKIYKQMIISQARRNIEYNYTSIGSGIKIKYPGLLLSYAAHVGKISPRKHLWVIELPWSSVN